MKIIYDVSMAKKAFPTLAPETLSAAKRLGGSLKRARVRRRLTQAQVSRRADIGLATLQRLEQGDPGVGIGAVLEVLSVLERNWLSAVIEPIESDAQGRALEQLRLPSRVVNHHDDV